jgi:twitching motility protein PilI
MAKRISLREFQQGLSERLVSAQGAAKADPGPARHRVRSDDLPGGSHWLIDLADSGEVVPLPQLTPAPLTKPWFAGIANIRGVLYSVVDFSAWRGGAPTPINAQSRLLLVGARHGVNSALLIRRALGLRPQMRNACHGDGGHPPQGADGPAPWLGGRFKDRAGPDLDPVAHSGAAGRPRLPRYRSLSVPQRTSHGLQASLHVADTSIAAIAGGRGRRCDSAPWSAAATGATGCP